VAPGSPANKADLREYDVITHFNGKEITTKEELLEAIHSSNIGEDVTITFVRGNSTKTASVRLTKSPVPK
jgi:S1-C subfamily serine protease